MNNVMLVFLVTLSIAFIASYSRLWVRLLKAKKETARLLVNKIVLEEYIKTFEDNKIQSDESIHKENFIKFISESRDWAFEYIETVQGGLGLFIDTVRPDIEYFNEYGEAGPGGANYEILKRISAAYEELIKLMPEEEKK